MSLLASFIPIATDSEGRAIPNALLYSYAVGTNTPKDTYSNVGLTVPNANPLESDGAGRFFNVYLGAGGYKLVLRDSNDVVLWTQDNYYQSLDGSDLTNINTSIDTLAADVAELDIVYTDTGVADAYVLAPTSYPTAPDSYVSAMRITFKPTNTNTGASTVNVSSLGVKNLLDQSGNALTAGFLETSKYFTFIYQSGAFRFMTKSGLIATSFNKIQRQVFSANGTWTKPSGLMYCVVEVTGAGGGGGRNNAGAGGGGGGGGYTSNIYASADLSGTVAVTVGTGGAGTAVNANGGNGGSSSFGAYLVCTGGAGGATAAGAGGAGGTASTAGDVSYSIGYGYDAITDAFAAPRGGYGAGVGGGNGTVAGTAGGNGLAPGAGGGGTVDTLSGSGANGIVIVTEYLAV